MRMVIYCIWRIDKLSVLCQMGEMECLVNRRNEARAALSVSVDDFLQEVEELPVNARLERLTVRREVTIMGSVNVDLI